MCNMAASPLLDPSLGQALNRIWSEILQRGDIGADADFFQLGGDSLQMMIMLFRVNETFGLDLTPEVVFENPTLGLFADAVSKALTDRTNTQEGAI